MSDHHPHSRPGLYDEIDRLQAGLTALIKRFQEVAADRDEWKQQHENLLDVHRRDLAALAARLRIQSENERIPESAQILALAHALRRARMHIANRGAFCGHDDMLRFLEETLRPYDNPKDPT